MRSNASPASVFWTSLAFQLAFAPGLSRRRLPALEWLGRAAADPVRRLPPTDIARAIEDAALEVLGFAHPDVMPLAEIRRVLLRLMVPFVNSPLIEHGDSTMRRQLTFLLDLKGDAAKHYDVEVDSTAFDTVVTEEEEEQAAIADLTNLLTHGRPVSWDSPIRIRSYVKKQLPTGAWVTIPATVSLVLLLLRAHRDLQGSVIERLASYFAHSDPPLSEVLTSLSPRILSQDAEETNVALKEFLRSYLCSTYNELSRDLVSGLQHLSVMPVPSLDAFLGIPTIAEQHTVVDLVTRLFNQPLGTIEGFGPRYSLGILILRSADHLPGLVEGFQRVVVGRTQESPARPNGLEPFANAAFYHPSILQGHWYFLMLLGIAQVKPKTRVGWQGKAISLAQWTREYVMFMLAPDGHGAERERGRRAIYCQALGLAVWVTGSGVHASQLSAAMPTGDEVVASWLLRGVVLAERLIYPLTYELPSGDLELNKVKQQLGVNVNPDLFPDLFNPFLYGPGMYDPSEVLLLGVLLATTQSSGKRPAWLSARTRKALESIVNRPLTAEEKELLEAREQKKPNRLNVILDRTAQEQATALLAIVSGWK